MWKYVEILMQTRRMHVFRRGLLALVFLIAAAPLSAQDGYLKPPQVVLDILDAPSLPTVQLSPDRTRMLIIERANMPTIADLAQPMLRLAGTRINPQTFGPHNASARTTGLLVRDLASGREVRVQVPQGAALSSIAWSPNGRMLTFANTTDNGIHLYAADPQTGAVRQVSDRRLNATGTSGFGGGSVCTWLADNARMLCRFVPDNVAAAAPAAPRVPAGPIIQESAGDGAPARTYQDLLGDKHDEALFDYYFTTQLAIVDVATGARTAIGAPAIFSQVSPSPNGQYVLVTRILTPYSYQAPYGDFPRTTQVWDGTGSVVHTVATYPLDSDRPGWVTALPRQASWRATAPATLIWAEALDEGNPRKQVEHRDKVMSLSAPFTADATEIARTPERFQSIAWLENGRALLSQFERTKRWRKTWLFQPDAPDQKWELLWDLSTEDAYRSPGSAEYRLGSTHPVVLVRGDDIYLTGNGASPQGDRPFLDRYNLRTKKAERLWQTDAQHYEYVVALLDDDGRRIITRRESVTEPPNYHLRDVRAGKLTALTRFPDPAPQLKGVSKQLVTYKRADGVPLSATLYLPPGYQAGTRLPVVMWAYPTEFANADVAGQVRGSPNRFTSVGGTSHLFFLTQGYAVFDNPSIPIIGGDTANNTYVQQLVGSAQAAVDKVVEMGVGDRHRIGVGGHSYGAFMTANLLAHSDLFRAGIARSGAYNRTLTPFGFQNEERTFWEAPQIYGAMSPFYYADKIKEPILLVHGEADNNSGTFPVQSERMYAALKGHGATVRYVVLPHESHGYTARESVLHTLAEMIRWFDTHVKNAQPSSTRPVSEP